MGNSFACFSPKITKKSPPKDHHHHHHLAPSSIEVFDEAYIKQQAQIASMLYQHHLQNNSDLLLHLDRSVSTKNPPSSSSTKKFSRKSRSVSSSNPLSLHLSNQDGQEKKHFVLVHGGGFGAWCWYKIIALLKEDNCEVDAINLTGSGLHFCDINSIKTIEQYAKPLVDFLANLPHNKKVILVGHDIGGACISLAMELYPSKISKAVFVAATMLSNDQSALDVFSQNQACSSELHQNAQKFIYANGKKHGPTSINFDESLLQNFLFNRTPSKDIALASVSMRAVPFVPLTEKLSLSAANYGSISRFYIKTEDDFAIPKLIQEAMIQSNPPKEVFEMKGSDHSPFFSRPRALHRILMEISNLPLK